MSSRDRACTGHGSLATRSQVINTAGLRNDYPFLSGLQAQVIRLVHQAAFLGRGVVTTPSYGRFSGKVGHASYM